MEQFKYIQPLDQMARISRTELGEKLDEILDKADKDNVGYAEKSHARWTWIKKRQMILQPLAFFMILGRSA